MKPETLKSELLLEDSGHSICCCCSSLNIFSNQFDKPEALKSKLLLEDSGHSICCFLFFFQHLFKSIDHYCLMSINYFLRNKARNSQNQTFTLIQWAQHLLFFVLLPTSFPINLVVIVCQSLFFSEMESEILKSEVLLEDSEYNICCIFSHLNLSRKLWCRHH